jgi:hypothetical protein
MVVQEVLVVEAEEPQLLVVLEELAVTDAY